MQGFPGVILGGNPLHNVSYIAGPMILYQYTLVARDKGTLTEGLTL